MCMCSLSGWVKSKCFACHRVSRLSFKACAAHLCFLCSLANDCKLSVRFSHHSLIKSVCVRVCVHLFWLIFAFDAQVTFWCVLFYSSDVQCWHMRSVINTGQGWGRDVITFCFSYLCAEDEYYFAICLKALCMCVCVLNLSTSVLLIITLLVLDSSTSSPTYMYEFLRFFFFKDPHGCVFPLMLTYKSSNINFKTNRNIYFYSHAA